VPFNELLFVCSTRAGAVLAQDHILKSDHFPSGRDATLTVQLPGAPNFRQVSPLSKNKKIFLSICAQWLYFLLRGRAGAQKQADIEVGIEVSWPCHIESPSPITKDSKGTHTFLVACVVSFLGLRSVRRSRTRACLARGSPAQQACWKWCGTSARPAAKRP
jgi:hypothetical protein